MAAIFGEAGWRVFPVPLQHVRVPRESPGGRHQACRWDDRCALPDGGSTGPGLETSRIQYLPRLRDRVCFSLYVTWPGRPPPRPQNLLLFVTRIFIFLADTCLLAGGGGGHWYPCFGFLMMSPSGFQSQSGFSLFTFFAQANVMYILPKMLLCCYTDNNKVKIYAILLYNLIFITLF